MQNHKSKRVVSISAIIVSALVIMFSVFYGQTVSASLPSRYQPTPAPTATPGDPPPNPTSIPLVQPLTTKEQALAQALVFDANMAIWDTPWPEDTLTSEPGRISMEAFASRAAESAASGYNEWFAPEVEADTGTVWRITIKGNVRLGVLGVRADIVNNVYDGVTYVISQRTGQLLSVTTGLPKK